ncbi:hypothetical protein HNQ77_002045 [Silvibacterium bohemicum]|uniref:Type ISP restriction-modification enzyme LLaBIII C-terminal specificity domain-containing protein n=1 Tax=Silvibacterium bohemicum TaxID=1577686 RepID=A0A841JRQ1_9BACT|nr:type ISP restriction/modification enzyme [Silvibacterium bohemicum]MBB6144093.1 hypothetical protein [Silvibacterium bohemicum]
MTRDWTDAELGKINALAAIQLITVDDALALLGERCVDVYLNGAACWAAVPINVWTYTLSGYQVLKKWLSYRESRLLRRALRPEETQYFAQIVRRIAAILLQAVALDANYLGLIRTATGLSSDH